MRISIDFETRSTVDLLATGVYPYAKHKHTDIWCFAWAIDDGDVQIWRNGDPFPNELRTHIENGVELRAWNAAFERIVWQYIGPRHGFPEVKMDQWWCTAAEAAAMALPRSLDQAAKVLGVKHKKDKEGYSLMLRMSKPRAFTDDGQPIWWDVPDRLQRLYEYCMGDVRAERSVFKVLNRLTPGERRAYLLTEKINDRGVPIDRALVKAAKKLVDEGMERAEVVLTELTDGEVTKFTQNARLTSFVNKLGVETAGVGKPVALELLAGELPDKVRKLLSLRLEVARSSTGKLKSMLDVADVDDDRARGLQMYHGAGTGRWTAKLIQPHNFPKGDVPDVERYIPDVMAGEYDFIDLFDNPVAIVSSLLRAMIATREGRAFTAADYSAIEARILNWVAGEIEVVKLFRDYDAATDPAVKWASDPYVRNAMRKYGLAAADVKKFPHRHVGKFMELGMGYQMGPKTAVRQGKDTYGIDLTEPEAKELVDSYRASHPNVVQFWKDGNNAAKQAVKNPGEVVRFGPMKNLAFVVRGSYLYLLLPSKRALTYAAPKIENVSPPWGYEDVLDEKGEVIGQREVEDAKIAAVTVWGVDNKTRQWVKYALYGGLITENIVQALARDMMLFGMESLEAAGYEVVMDVHDEIINESPNDFGSIEEVERIMRQIPEWLAGCPINAEGWRGERYRK